MIDYNLMYKTVKELEGKSVKAHYVDSHGSYRIIIAELVKYLENPSKGSVVFDIIPNKNISYNGFETVQLDSKQKWEYQIEFGTSIYNNLVRGEVLKNQISNSLWITYTNPFGLRMQKTSLKLLKLEFNS